MKGEMMAKRSSFGSIVRKKLSDITNSLPQPKSPIHDEKLLPTASSAKEYIDHLLQENMALMKLIADKNKIIELSGTELRKMRISLQKLQLQNWNLARTNSHISAELNLGNEKLKELQHEIMCNDALLKAKNLEQGKNVGEHKSYDENKPRNGHRRRPARSKSMGPSATFQLVEEKETVINKRRCLRRQSARSTSRQQEPIENLFEIEDAKFPVVQPLHSSMHEDGLTSLGSSIKMQEKDEKCSHRFEAKESQRTSIGRPLRRAVEKVQSYKEASLNIKMRRSD
uniref:Putative shugoshin-1-like n=1 Tax=Davidia involucrata TaxID=16924 RepID=A0A5B7CBJ6_DAVIN